MDRRELFTSITKPFKEKIVRPPYFKNESKFLKSCITCSDKSCKTVCEENIIVIQKDGTPKIDFKLGGCTYCDECAKACDEKVLKLKHKKNINVKFSIDTIKCMSWNNTMCFSCKDPCLDNAINFNGMFQPMINNESCTACGFCINVCPTDAIKFQII